MKIPKWHAKALYLIFALALVAGLTIPAAVAAGEGTVYISGPSYAKAGQLVQFQAVCEPMPTVPPSWDYGDLGTDSGLLVGHIYANPGIYTVTVTATWDTITQTDEHEIYIDVADLIPQEDYNIIGSSATFRVPEDYEGHVVCWDYLPSWYLGEGYGVVPGTGRPECPGTSPYPGDNSATVWAVNQGELMISAWTEAFPGYEADRLDAMKKWGKIDDTWLFGFDPYTYEAIYGSGETQVWWDENSKSWIGGTYLIDAVIGTFITDGGEISHHLANGADVEWWVMDARAPVHELPSGIPAYDYEEPAGHMNPGLVTLIEDMQAAYPAHHVGFDNCDTKYYETVSGDLDIDGQKLTGLTGVELVACGEESVKIVVLAKYPERLHDTQWPVFPEIISWNFWTQEVEKVPQVKWAGEEIVLEKQFGVSYTGFPVNFILEGQSIGALEGLSPRDNRDANGRSVWTTIDELGVARALLHTQSQGKSNVICLLYEPAESPTKLINKHGFMVYWLAIEEVTLGNMQGERDYHNDGLWDPVLDSGMVTSATINSITDDTASWDVNEFVGKTIEVWKGEDGEFMGDLQIRVIVSNTADTVVVDPNWDKLPKPPNDVQWYYQISDPVWDPALDDLSQELNVSQDALLRARVKGWFYDPERESIREKSWCDVNANGVKDMYDYVLPEGRWVLPDDWEYLAGPDWEQDRPHWDIMTQPNDNIMSEVDPTCGTPVSEGGLKEVIELGDYFKWTLSAEPDELDIPGDLVAEAPVIGPYSTLDTYVPEILYKDIDPVDGVPETPVVPAGIDYNGNGSTDDDGRKTIVPNSKLNWWDCPMPPAKIIFEITDGAGFFKDVNKGQVYYEWVNTDYEPGYEGIAYTNPFYFEMIPDSPLIPPFVNNGGVDWDSWDSTYGPYPFWTIINQPPGMTPSDDQHPTKVHVYSDNHGEAMVWLNGDWNLKLGSPPYDIPTGTVVGNTTVIAAAEYPYFRGEFPKVLTNDVEKTWTWGVDIRGYGDLGDPWRMVIQTKNIDGSAIDPVTGLSNMKMAFIWVCDRDGMPVENAKIDWQVHATNGAKIAPYDGFPSPVLDLADLEVVDGFLVDTDGEILNVERTEGVSYTRLPTDPELYLWESLWDNDPPCNHGVAAVLIYATSASTQVELVATLHLAEGKLTRSWNLDFSDPDPQNPHPDFHLEGDLNDDDLVNVADILLLTNMILGVAPESNGADVNEDGIVDARDIIALRKISLGG